MGPPGWIPTDVIWAWCDRIGVDAELTDLIVDVLGILDADREERLASKGA